MERRLVGRGWGRLAQRQRTASRAAALASAIVLALLWVSPALGHAELATSDPENGAVLDTPPTTVATTFTEGLDAGKSSIRILGPDGNTEVAEAHPAKDGSKTITADALVLAPGTYVVRWTAAATDGHIERGRFEFTVNEPTPPPATPSPTPAPSATASVAPTDAATPSASATPSLAPTPSPSGDQAPAASSSDVLLPIVAALALVGVVGYLVLRRSRAA